MAARILRVVKFATKVTIAGGALYVAYDAGLLGDGKEGSVALGRAKAAVPPAVEEWMKYFSVEVREALKLSLLMKPKVEPLTFDAV
uniref:MICOS complex subunit MIC13 n=1 Tax=Cyprinus carpio TaxID=7962 RepID=A0A8C1X5C5_CYPCA